MKKIRCNIFLKVKKKNPISNRCKGMYVEKLSTSRKKRASEFLGGLILPLPFSAIPGEFLFANCHVESQEKRARGRPSVSLVNSHQGLQGASMVRAEA